MSLPIRAAVVVSFVATAAQAATFSSLVSFGDSLSDIGNLRSAAFNAIPGAPGYFDGRFSNGPIWIDGLSAGLGLPAPVRSTAGGNDYAYGLATSGTGTTPVPVLNVPIPNVRTQITGYAAANVSTPTALYTVLGGANDLIGAIEGGATPVQQGLAAQAAANNIVAGVQALYNDGARNILVANLPDLGNLPRFRGTSNQAAATGIAATFDSSLGVQLSLLTASSPGLNLYSLDLATLFTQAQANPGSFGLTNVTDPAYTNDPNYLGSGTAVANPAGYLFWDSIHPSAKGHSLVAAAALAAVPEPSAMAVVALALPLLRRRRV